MSLWKKFKELMTARYSMGKIRGCEPGTLAYRHEQRHEWQDKHGWLNFYSTMCFLIIPVMALVTGNVRWVLLIIVFSLLIEADAWIHSIRKPKKPTAVNYYIE